jgi:PPOX class probable F420-dependent enzyme
MQRFLEHGHTGTAGPEGPPPEVSARLARARVARLATLHDTAPRVAPVTFAWTRGRVVWAVDDHKAKTGRRLRRLADIAADPRVSVLVDHYEEDWSALWWIEVLGTAAELRGHEATAALDALAARYPAYAERRPPGPVVGITPVAWRWWQAAD